MSYRFTPIAPSSDQSQQLAMINQNFAQLDQEAVTKVFNGPNGQPASINGQLPYGGHGSLYYDQTGTDRILIGTAPDDGRVGIWVSAPGQSVLTLLGA